MKKVIFIMIVFISACGNLKYKGVGLRKELQDYWYLRTEDRAAWLYLKEIGDNEPVLVVHGGPGAGHQYMVPISAGLESTFKFIYYDQRGSGYSYCPVDSITLQKHVSDIESIRKALGIEKLNIVSHSFGTMIVMDYLKKYPQMVKNIVLLGAMDPKNGDAGFFSQEELKLFTQKNDEVAIFEGRPEVKEEIKKAGLDKPTLTSKEQDKLRFIQGAAGDIYNIQRWQQRFAFIVNRESASATMQSTDFRYDWSSRLAAHPFSITIINGEYDFPVGLKGNPIWKRVIATEVKNVSLVELPKAGHLSWIDEPELFRIALKSALMN